MHLLTVGFLTIITTVLAAALPTLNFFRFGLLIVVSFLVPLRLKQKPNPSMFIISGVTRTAAALDVIKHSAIASSGTHELIDTDC